uniref:Conotoxin Cal9.2a n=1 Tax=Californiconus californicus TaxID=1736779 RepID=CU92A_CONCL|nr:RecName: Full=Conotoxin Cal9.2a; Flags: Precursor [Californiconus californicus]ADB65790.1 conotoxin Cal 9.2a precursor [Californiconus californicus]
MNCYLILTVALLLTSAMTGTTTAGQLNKKGVTLREDDGFPCNAGNCACLPLDSYSYTCQSPTSSTANCEGNECVSEADW